MPDSLTVLLAPSRAHLQVLALLDRQEILRALLPPPHRAHPRALPTLLESLALWSERPARVVWSADDSHDGSNTALLDALGFGETRLHFHVEWAPQAPRRARSLKGPASFRALRTRALEAVAR